MRELSPGIRERSLMQAPMAQVALRTTPVLLLVATLFAFLGLGAAGRSFWVRFAETLAVETLGFVLGATIFNLLQKTAWSRGRRWAPWFVTGLLTVIPLGVATWGAEALLADPAPTLSALPYFIELWLIASPVGCLLVASIAKPYAPPRSTSAKFFERLPVKLRGAQLWAVEAHDHYLRLHTSKGRDLILLTLSDAIAELDGLEGRQTHRSWWVAKDALADARRKDGRWLLALPDGTEVPVSRRLSGDLRKSGWF